MLPPSAVENRNEYSVGLQRSSLDQNSLSDPEAHSSHIPLVNQPATSNQIQQKALLN